MEPPVTKIQASPRFGLEIKEIIAKHELLFYFMWRNFKIRYKQTVIGAGWAVFKPFILMVVFTLLFNKTINVKTGAGNIPYPIFSYVGLLFWTYFSQTVVQVGTSMVDNQSIFTKIYFPRLIIPLSTTLTGLIDFAAAALIYIVMMLHYGIYPTLSGSLLFIPMLLLSMITVMGMGCYMAALNVRYRDVSQGLPFLIQVLLFLTPVIAAASVVPGHWRWILFLNPMAGVIETMRASLLGTATVDVGHLMISVASALFMLIFGIRYFKHQEKIFADIV